MAELTEETAGDDPQLLLMVAEMRLRSGQTDEALAIARKLLASDSSRRDQVAMVPGGHEGRHEEAAQPLEGGGRMRLDGLPIDDMQRQLDATSPGSQPPAVDADVRG